MSKFSVNKPYTVFVAVIIIALLGIISFMSMTTDLLPKIDLPYVVVVTSYPGASPEEVETVVTRPLEQNLATTGNIKNIRSVSNENSSFVILEFYPSANMDTAMIELSGKLDLVKSYWSEGVGSPMMMKINPDALPIMFVSVDEDNKTIGQTSKFATETLIPELEKLNGVASVTGSGLLEYQIKIVIDQTKIDLLNKKILDLIDEDLADVQETLDDAKAKLAEGEDELAQQTKEKGLQLTQGQAGIIEGKIGLSQAEGELRSSEAQLNMTLGVLNQALTALQTEEQKLLTTKAELELLPQPLAPEQEAQYQLTLTALEGTAVAIEQTNAGIAQLNAGFEQLNAGRAMLEEKRAQLKEGENLLNQGQAAFTQGINQATGKLAVADATMQIKLEEFEKAKDDAFKQASLDGVVTPSMVSQLIMAQNFAMPAGYITKDNIDYLVKVGDKIADVEQLRETVLFSPQIEGMEPIKITDVATVEEVNNEEEIYAQINGNPGVILSMQKQSMYSTSQVSDTLNQRMEALQTEYPGLHITTLMDQGVYINIVVDNVLNNLLYGGILAIIILLLFLKSIKPTFVVALSIPVSVVFALVLMYFSGVTLNVISLAGLALGVGMLVDNSIVVIENIYRLRHLGVSAKDAAIKGAKQVTGAIFASTLTTICVFLPIVFTDGISRQLFTDMGLTIAYSLVASLLIALTVVPAMSAGMLKNVKEKEHKLFDRFKEFYAKVLTFTLRFKFIVIIIVVGLLVFCGVRVFSTGTSFMPAMDSTQISVNLTMPKGSTLEDTKKTSNEVIDQILTIPDVKTVGAMLGNAMSAIGGMGEGSGAVDSVVMYVLLNEERAQTSQEVSKQIAEKTAGIDCEISVTSSDMDMSALSGSGVSVVIKGDNGDTLQNIAKDLAKILADTPGTTDIDDGMKNTTPEVRISVDKEKAMEYGLTVAQVYSSVSSAISSGQSTTSINTENTEYPVIVIDAQSLSTTPSNIKYLKIPVTDKGEKTTIDLYKIATITEAQGLSSINRDAQERYLTVSASVLPDYNIGLVSRDFESRIANYTTPEGYSIKISGENETIMNTLRDLSYMLLLAIALIYLIMVAQFQSLLSPFIVMFTIPLAFTGGFLAIMITGLELSMIAMLGFLILTGIVVNNGIVFVDYINQLRKSGMPQKQAIIEAGKTRLRPILMTALTTILGLLTLSLGVGTGADMLQPMAIATIGGLSYATLLTLFFIPVLYDIFNGKERRLAKKALKSGNEEKAIKPPEKSGKSLPSDKNMF